MHISAEFDPPNNTLQYQVSRREAIDQIWRLMLRPRLIVGIALIFLFGVGTLALRPERPLWAWPMIIFPCVFLLFLRWMVHKIVAQHPEFLEPQTVTFDDSGICISNSVTRVNWPWTRVRGVTDSTGFYVLRFDTFGSAAIIPKRALTPQQTERLLSYVMPKVA